MIFKKLFKPKWQHKDPAVRAQALQQLTDEHILNEIASKDVEVNVRRKALEKMASFSAWVQAMEHESDQHLKKVAIEKIKLAVLNSQANSLKVTDAQKQTFFETCKQNSLIEEVIRHSSDTELRLKLLKRLNKESLLTDLIFRESEQAISQYCFDSMTTRYKDDLKLLEKIANKAANQNIKQQAQGLLTTLKAEQQHPVELKKDLTLILSKLLALKDKQDFLIVESANEELVNQWQQKQKAFACLSQAEQTSFKQKYDDILIKVESTKAALKQSYLEQKAAQDAIAKREETIKQAKAQLWQIDSKVSGAIENSQDESHNDILVLIEQAKTELEQSHETGREIEALFHELNQYQNNVQHLDAFFEQVSQATCHLTQLAQMQIPTTVSEYDEVQAEFTQWHKTWNQNQKRMLFSLPEAVETSADTQIKEWRAAIKTIELEQSKQTKRLFAKLRELKSLIRSGKYNAAFGLYRKINEWNEGLSQVNKAKFEHELASINEQIADLEDWKAYIGLPRKRELLEEMQALVDQPLSDLQAQANKVKFARHTWLLLGNVESEENTHLNTKFDELTEQAFAPCRAFYAELEQQRKDNLLQKQQLIEQAALLLDHSNESTADFNLIGKQLYQLQNDWRTIGPVDKKVYKSINEQFYETIEPIKSKVHDYQQQNEQKKLGLINQAKAKIAECDDLNDVSETLKALQTQWKSIGFAGKRKENKLWAQFRAINDDVFQQKQMNYENSKVEKAQLFEQQAKVLEQLESDVNAGKLEYADLTEQINAIELSELNKNQQIKLSKWQNKLLNMVSKAQNQQKQAKEIQAYVQLFELLSEITESTHENETDLEKLSSTIHNPDWVQAIRCGSQVNASDNKDQQAELTTQIEIVQNVPTPERFQAQRMQLQMQMLSDKMNSGSYQAADEMLLIWLKLGLIDLDRELLERTKAAFT